MTTKAEAERIAHKYMDQCDALRAELAETQRALTRRDEDALDLVEQLQDAEKERNETQRQLTASLAAESLLTTRLATAETRLATAEELGIRFRSTDDGERTRCDNVRAQVAETRLIKAEALNEHYQSQRNEWEGKYDEARAACAATKVREERLRAALAEIAAHCACTCDEIWTSRGMHHPNECKSYLIADIDAALAEKPEGKP